MIARVATYLGPLIDLADVDPALVNEFDVAIALGNTCRYAGMCRPFYSVAQHSIVLHDYALARTGNWHLALDALTHDVVEYLTPDVGAPLKPFVLVDFGSGPTPFREWEENVVLPRIREAIAPEILPTVSAYVKAIDDRIVYDEWTFFDNPGKTPDWVLRRSPLGVKLRPMSPDEACHQWLDRLRRTRRMAKDRDATYADVAPPTDEVKKPPRSNARRTPDQAWEAEAEHFRESANESVVPLTED